MNPTQRKVVWIALLVLALPVGILFGGPKVWIWAGFSDAAAYLDEKLGLFIFVLIAVPVIAVVLYIRAGGKKDENAG